MKNLLKLIPLLSLVITISGCETLGLGSGSEEPLTFPTLVPCTPQLLETNKSFICKKAQKGADLIETNIKFESDSFTLNDQAKDILNKLYAYLKLTGTTQFTIKGYTGKIDSKLISDKELLTEHDIRLSKNRAVSVREYLLNKGIEPADGIIIKALGYQDPIAPNDSSSNRALNQRVEITLKSKLIEQIDNIEEKLDHLYPAEYSKFFSNVYLLNDDELEDVATIYDSSEKRPVLAVNFNIFANKEYTARDNSSNFIIISKPQPISMFNDDQKVFRLGSAKYKFSYKDITSMIVTDLSREASVGDYIIPNDIVAEKLPEKTFKMEATITANVLEDVVNTRTFSSSFNSVLLNKGTADGLKVGAEMILYQPETRTDGYPVPPKYSGYGFVYRTSNHYSIALIVNSVQEITSNSMATTSL